MKKSILSLLLILSLMLSAVPAAFAETTIDLGTIAAGSEAKVYIADAPYGTVESESLPAGCYIENSGGKLYLCGSPFFAGSYEFRLYSDEDFGILCKLSILPATPTVQSCSDVNCEPGSFVELYVDSYTGDSGSISYQWYLNDSRSSSGGTAISGATGCWFTPNTGVSGSAYYYCMVTNTNCGLSASALSSPITVTVGKAGPRSISVSSMPKKTEYVVGDMLDPEGLKILVDYPDEQKTITEDFELSPMQLKTEGIQSVTVTYDGRSCSFPVNVKAKAERKLEIISRPSKLSYKVGDRLDTKGLKLRLTDGNNVSEFSSGFSCTPTTLNSSGSQIITVKYEDLSCTFSVQVEEGRREISISVKSLPTRTAYTVGESLDTSGLVLNLSTSEGSESLSSGFTFNPSVFNSKGRQLVELRYHDLTCTFVVNVSDKPAEPSPSPSPVPSAVPSASPVIPGVQPSTQPGSEAGVYPRPSHAPAETKSNSGAVIVLIVSIVALTALSAYVIIMNNGGVKGLLENLKRNLKR